MRQQYLVADEEGYLIKKKRNEPPQNPMMGIVTIFELRIPHTQPPLFCCSSSLLLLTPFAVGLARGS